MGKVIGIDLGTTNSCVAVMEGGSPVVISNSEGQRTTPSVVAFTKDGEQLVGDIARRQAAVNPKRTISSIKREMGSEYRAKIDGKNYSPEEISSMILRKLKSDAENYLGQSITQAVITVPAYFSDAQRQATKAAGRIAGLDVMRIINEPTSAALAYGLDHGKPQKIMVYDLGGGTFDVSLIEIGDNLIEVLATSGNNHLGGDDFDDRLTDYIVEEYKKTNHINLEKNPATMQRVREAAEEAKKTLSLQTTASVNLPFVATVQGEPIHLYMDITRAQFEKLTSDLVDMTEGPVRQVLQDAGIRASDLGMVLLVGGSTRIPSVQEKVRQLTGKEPSRNLNPDECVALGAAIQGGKLSGEVITGSGSELILMDVTPLTLSIETVGGIATKIIDRNSTIPCHFSQIFSTAMDFQSTVEIKILQGERQFARDNSLLGNFRLSGIRRAPAGVPQIEVAFDIDANGILNVTARDLASGRQNQITITSGNGLSEDEIQKAIRDARVYAGEDTSKKERFDIMRDARNQISAADHFLVQNRKSLDKEKKKEIRSMIGSLQKLLRIKKPENMSDAEKEEIQTLVDQLRELTKE